MNKRLIILILVNLLYSQIARSQFFTKIINSPISTNLKDSRSINWVDVNNDDKIDLFISNGPYGGQNNSLFINTGLGTFSLVTNDSIVLDNMPSDGATFSDIDNDGDLDGFVVNWYNVNNLFYLNNGNGTFTKNNSQILSNDLGYSETASWGDYDKDGLVDLYVTNSAGIKKNYLYHNDGSSNFTKVTSGSVVNDAYFSRNVSWVDIDLDNDLDLFVTNENNQNENIYRNDGSGTFTKLLTGPLLLDGGNTNSSSWADYDNDGDLDVFLANDLGVNSLFENNGNFNFTKITSDTVVKTPSRSFSSAWSDIDNDGDLDLFVTNSFASGTKLINYFYLNDGTGNFTRNSTDPITQDSSWSYGCAFGDYDNDGFEDLAVATCRYNGIDSGDFLYHNNTNSNNWITIKLKGTVSNKTAIGTKVRIKTIINGQPVWQMREISAQSSYNGQNDLRAHFGLKDAISIDTMIIEWPLGMVEKYFNISSNQFIEYIEGGSFTGLTKDDHNLEDKIKIYPKPASNFINVKAINHYFQKGDNIKLLDIHGTIRLDFNIQGKSNEVSLDLNRNNVSIGIYILYYETLEGAHFIDKILIE